MEEGRISVNGETIEQVGTIIDEDKDVVEVDGTEVNPVTEKVYLLLYKPREVMTTLHDPFKRKTVAQLLREFPHRVYPVGRLDFDTEGVLLLTNDGDLAYRLTHPKYNVKKVYEAVVKGKFQRADGDLIARGVELEDGAVGRALVRVLEYSRRTTRLRLTLTEGRKREVRQLCEATGHPVQKLKRVEFGGIAVKGLSPGKWRTLTEGEVRHLKIQVGLK